MLSMLGILIPIGIVIFILLLILSIMNRSSGFSFVKFYFTIIAIVSIIGMAIAFGIALYQQGMQALITDEEYLTNRGHRELQQCKDPTYAPMKAGGEDTAPEALEKTPEEIATCQQEVREKIAKERSFSTKEATIGGLTRGLIFLVLFLTHYPRMIAEQAQAEAPATPKKRAAPRKRIAKK